MALYTWKWLLTAPRTLLIITKVKPFSRVDTGSCFQRSSRLNKALRGCVWTRLRCLNCNFGSWTVSQKSFCHNRSWKQTWWRFRSYWWIMFSWILDNHSLRYESSTLILYTRSYAAGGPRLDRRTRIQLGRVHFGVFSTSRFGPPALSSDWTWPALSSVICHSRGVRTDWKWWFFVTDGGSQLTS